VRGRGRGAEARAVRISERIQLWRDDAAVLRRRGARRAAALLERVAAELEEDVRGPDGAPLDEVPELVEMRAAVALSGYTRGHLRRMLVARTLTNYGTEARPLLRAADLPRKPGRVQVHACTAGADEHCNTVRKTPKKKGRTGRVYTGFPLQ
jgi:hypothetical protein